MSTVDSSNFNTPYLSSDQSVSNKTASANLTEQQQSLLQEFKEILPKIINIDKTKHDDEGFCDEACLLRYLRATKWKLEDSIQRLKSTLEWRREYQPHLLAVDDFLEAGEKGQMYVNGFDNQNRPIVYLVPANRTITDEQKKIQFLVFTLETAIKCLPQNVEKFCFLIDFRGQSSNNSISLSGTKQTIQIFSQHYPERVGKVFFIEATWLLSGFFRFISPLIDPVTREKFTFISLKNINQPKGGEQLSNHISSKYLYTEFGGENVYKFSSHTYYEAIRKLYQKDSSEQAISN